MTLHRRLDKQIDAEVYKAYYESISYTNTQNVNAFYQYHESSYDNYYYDHNDNSSNEEYDSSDHIGCFYYILIAGGIIIGIYLLFKFLVFVVSSI